MKRMEARGITSMFFDPMPGGAQDAKAMGFIDHQSCVIFSAQLDGIGEIEDVAVHAEDCVSDDQLSNSLRCPAQQTF